MELKNQIEHMERSLIKYEGTHPHLRREEENAYIPMIKAILTSLKRLKELETEIHRTKSNLYPSHDHLVNSNK